MEKIHSAEKQNSIEKLSEQIDEQLDKYNEFVPALLELRHELFDVNGTEFDKNLPISNQLYDLPEYNYKFIYHDLGTRDGNVRNYHEEIEKYNHSDDEYTTYRKAIMHVAQELGFVAKQPGIPSEEVDRKIGILDSSLEPIPEKVSAVVINGAAGMSNLKRVRDSIRNIENGRIDTDVIILSGGTRPVDEKESAKIVQPFKSADNEIGLLKQAAVDLLGVEFNDKYDEITVPYGHDLTAKVWDTKANIGGREVTIYAIEAPFDTERKLDDGRPAWRINTIEAFEATLPILEPIDGAVVMESHDTWTPWQDLIAKKIFGVRLNRNVYPSGPFNAERITMKDGQIDITQAEGVVDEIAKTYHQLIDLQFYLRTLKATKNS